MVVSLWVLWVLGGRGREKGRRGLDYSFVPRSLGSRCVGFAAEGMVSGSSFWLASPLMRVTYAFGFGHEYGNGARWFVVRDVGSNNRKSKSQNLALGFDVWCSPYPTVLRVPLVLAPPAYTHSTEPTCPSHVDDICPHS